MKFNIDLPFFPGLYESYLYSSDDAYFAIKDELDYYHWDYCSEWGPGEPEEKQFYEQLTEDDLDFNFTDYSKDIVDAFVDVWKSHAPEIVLSIGEYHMWSPRMYNFDTDHIYADIELRDDWKDVMRGFMTENTDWLRDRIKKDWTSYDGFMSFMSNDIDEWDKYLFEEQDCRYISTMLGYMMYRENEEIIRDMSYEAREDICPETYVFITEDGKEKLANLKAEWEEGVRIGTIRLPDDKQLEIPFETE